MAPGGVYDQHSDYQLRGALTDLDLVGDVAAEIVPDPERGSVVIVDYGCAQGRVTNALLHVAVERLRDRDADVPINVYHNDLLGNDWATLLERLEGDDSYLRIPGGPITPLISATSFYEPVTPRHLVDLGISFAAAQWLASPGPGGTGTALYFDQLEGAAAEEMAAQADADWARFLELRADELAPGGRLIVNMMGIPAGGIAAGHDLWEHVRAICADMIDEGRLDKTRVDGYVLPVYERTAEEVRRPFEEAIGQRLSLGDLEIRAVPNPVRERYRHDGDAGAFARDFTGFFRAWSEPSLEEALMPDGGIDELYRRLERRLEEDAEEFSFEIHAVTSVMTALGRSGDSEHPRHDSNVQPAD
jgi:SAM dependent carboxyl methyltransferase